MTYFIIFIIAIVLAVIYSINKDKKQKNLTDQKAKELGIRGFLDSGKYVTGHSKITTSNIFTLIYIKDGLIHIISKTENFKELGIIPLKDVENVLVEDASSIEKRVTATRLLTIGLFAFAAKKKEKNELFYVTIIWKDGKFDQETIFEFAIDPKVAKVIQNPSQTANILKNEIINRANAIKE
jgi:hypothetical protein